MASESTRGLETQGAPPPGSETKRHYEEGEGQEGSGDYNSNNKICKLHRYKAREGFEYKNGVRREKRYHFADIVHKEGEIFCSNIKLLSKRTLVNLPSALSAALLSSVSFHCR